MQIVKSVEKKNFPSREIVLKEAEKLSLQALSLLSPRNQRIVSLFFGLDGKSYSLAAIGKKMNITRERARQIKVESLKKIRKNFNKFVPDNWPEFLTFWEQFFLEQGGFLEMKRLGELMKKNLPTKNLGQINLLLSLAEEQFSFEKKSVKIKSFWRNKKNGPKRKEIIFALEVIVTFLKEQKTPFYQRELKNMQFPLTEKFSLETEIGRKRVLNLLFLSTSLGRNILRQWGFLTWPIITANFTRERVYLVLKKSGQSLHFRRIAELIKEYWPEKKVVVQTVHNELIKDRRFVLERRGVYGLSEWKNK